ncbi:DUF167 domain-containing protein [Gemmatimonadota bacterium]
MTILSGGPLGTDIRVQAQPRASRSEIVGPHGGALKIRVAAPPVEGAANQELEKLLAKTLGVPRSSVEVVRGGTGKRKLLRIKGLSPDEVGRRLGI